MSDELSKLGFTNPVKNTEPRINANTRDEMIGHVMRAIYNADKYVCMFGYDNYFMDNEDTQTIIRNAIKGNNGFMSEPVFISAIVSKYDNASFLDDLAKESAYFNLKKIPQKISQGYIVCDDNGAFTWDSMRLTHHPIEQKEGIIQRSYIPGIFSAKRRINHFNEIKKQYGFNGLVVKK